MEVDVLDSDGTLLALGLRLRAFGKAHPPLSEFRAASA